MSAVEVIDVARDEARHAQALEHALRPVPRHDPGSTLPASWHEGPFMQIFVRAYQDSNGDGIGDLRGLIARLDYLQELGVTGLWLMPIHPSDDGDHGYAVSDYRAIDLDYGTLEDFDALLREAHRRGIGIVIDYLVNHAAASHPLFVSSRGGPQSPHRDWFVWQDSRPEGWRIYEADPWRHDDSGAHYFAAFSRRMPDFNWLNPEVQAWHHDNLRFWLNRGVDGFRFDAVGHLVENGPDAWNCQPQNHAIMARMRELLEGYEHRFMVCEAPGDPAGFTRSGGSAFAFDLNGSLVDAARGDVKALHFIADYFRRAPQGLSTLLANHDSFAGQRVSDQLGGNEARCKLAAALLLLLPGRPFLYYGEEIGLAGHPGLPPDAALRTPMSWAAPGGASGFTDVQPFRAASPNADTHHVAAQRGELASLHGFYRTLIALRRQHAALRHGSFELQFVRDGVLCFLRVAASERALVLLNTADQEVAVSLPQEPGAKPWAPLYPAAVSSMHRLPARSVRLYGRAGGQTAA